MFRFHVSDIRFAVGKARKLKAVAEGRTLTACQAAYAAMTGYVTWAELKAVTESDRRAPSPLDEEVDADERASRTAYHVERLAGLWAIPREEAEALVHKARPTGRMADGTAPVPTETAIREWWRTNFLPADGNVPYDPEEGTHMLAEDPLLFDIATEIREQFPDADAAVVRALAKELFERGPWVRAEEMKGFFASEEELLEEDRRTIRRVIEGKPYLNYHGFGVHDRDLTPEQRRALLAERREEMTSDQGVAEFRMAQSFLRQLERRKQPNPAMSSYGLKGRMETWMRKNSVADTYVSNGMLIAAALDLGLPVKVIDFTPNALIGFTSRSLKRLEAGLDTNPF